MLQIAWAVAFIVSELFRENQQENQPPIPFPTQIRVKAKFWYYEDVKKNPV